LLDLLVLPPDVVSGQIDMLYYAPAPAGTPLEKRVMKLTDGTVIKNRMVPKLSSWDYEAIHLYLEGRAEVRPLGEIVGQRLRPPPRSRARDAGLSFGAVSAVSVATQCFLPCP
jgi:hypothetical protein